MYCEDCNTREKTLRDWLEILVANERPSKDKDADKEDTESLLDKIEDFVNKELENKDSYIKRNQQYLNGLSKKIIALFKFSDCKLEMQDNKFNFTLQFTGNPADEDWNDIVKEFIIQEMSNVLSSELLLNDNERLW